MQASARQSRFSEMVKFRAPAGLREAIDLVARQRHTTVSEMCRQLLLRELQRDGVHLDEGGRFKNESGGIANGRKISGYPGTGQARDRRQRSNLPPCAPSEE